MISAKDIRLQTMTTNNILFLRGPDSSVYILVPLQRSTGTSTIREILSGQIQLILPTVLVENRADILNPSRKYFFPASHGVSTAAGEEIRKHTFASLLKELSPFLTMGTLLHAYKGISSAKKLSPILTFNTFDMRRDIEDILHLFPKDPKDPRESELPSIYDVEEVQALQDEREIKTEYGTIIASATSTSLLGEGVIKPKEREPKKQGVKEVEKAKSQLEKELGEGVENLESSKAISYEEKVEFLNKAASHVHDIFDARLKGIKLEEFIQQQARPIPKKGDIFSHQPKQEKALQPPDLSEIPLYRGHRGRRRQGSPSEVRPLDFLKIHYGQWLSSFGAEENKVYQDQIRAHDSKLIQGVKNQLREEGKGRKVSDFVKTRSARLDRELENVSVADLKKTRRLASTLYSRETRAAKAKAAAPARSVTRK